MEGELAVADKLPAVGGVVRVRARTYLVEALDCLGGGGTLVRLACLDDDAQGQQLEVIWEIELDAQTLDGDGWQSIGKSGFDLPRYFSAYIHTLRWNCVTATDPGLFQSPFRAGIQIDAYQLEPLRKSLRLPRVNLFIADDVGLGKTIEAGLIATELLLRRRVREVVVACPPSMLQQWKDEMEARFCLVFEILDRAYLERVRQERGFGVNPWTTYPRFLVSHKLLTDETYTGPLRNWLDNLRPSTLFIFDEAHHAAPSSGARYAIDSRITRAIRDIAKRFEHRLFLSATPHNGHSNSFSALLELLDDQRFTRGVRAVKSNVNDVMVRRLKEDLRQLAGGFPKREICQEDLKNLSPDAPELRLSRLLDEYRRVRQLRLAGATKRKQAEAVLLVSGLQQRLLSSIEAFARTLSVHRRTMERIWAGEVGTAKGGHTLAGEHRLSLELLRGVDRDDERSQLSEDEQLAMEEIEVESATADTAGDNLSADIKRERVLLDEMQEVADGGRGLPDARVRYLLEWVRERMCEGARLPGEPSPSPGAKWTDLRLLIFTEYEDTRRYLVEMLRAAVADTDLAEYRIDVYQGPTPPDKREAIKRAFNLPPDEHPVRILVATDAAPDGINLQAHCHHVFHFDVPWNPSRLEQRNGRIDRKLQPSPVVYCHYFVYTQRPEVDLLEEALQPRGRRAIPEVVSARLHGSIRQDVEELLLHLEKRGQEARQDAEAKLMERGRIESESLRKVLEDQKRRVDVELGRTEPVQLALDFRDFDDIEKKQLESNRRYWRRWLANVEGDLQHEPARVREFYKVTSFRIEPVGLAYLWPVTG